MFANVEQRRRRARRRSECEGCRGALRLAAAAFCVASHVLHAAAGPDPAEILRRAEEIRSPDLDYVVDFTIRFISPDGRRPDRTGTYTMLARGKDRTFVLMRTPEPFFGGTLLIDGGKYWLLLPRATKPLELMERNIIQGDIAMGDLARANLALGYQARLEGEEALDGEPCFKLDLTRAHESAHYSRIVAWIAKKKYVPLRFDYYGQTGRLVRSARYLDYRKGPLGTRATRIEVEGTNPWEDRSVLEFTDLRVIRLDGLEFTPEAMPIFRDAALEQHGVDGIAARPEDFLPRAIRALRRADEAPSAAPGAGSGGGLGSRRP